MAREGESLKKPALIEGLDGLPAVPCPLPVLDASGLADACISLEAEVPAALFDGMRDFIHHHPHWDQYSVISTALAGFLVQNGYQDQSVNRHYLEGLFQRP
ncbi:MAG: DUF2811 domain-containing protein [Synechococcaceae cyanobacterium ELA739]|jgi:hypothetical protein